MVRTLAEKRILVVEDEYFLADEIRRELEAVGAAVIGPAPSVQRALQLLATASRIDAAVLDVNLGGEIAYPVADALLARSIPFVFTSGYDDDVLGKLYPHVRCCQKPCEFRSLGIALAKSIHG